MLKSVRATLLVLVLTLALGDIAAADCPVGDLYHDCEINFKDVEVFAQQWLLGEPGSIADLIGNDGVNAADFAILAQHWLEAVPTGSVRVAITPQGAIDAGAQWRVKDFDWLDWRDSWDIEPDVPVGWRTIEYKDIGGWIKPIDEAVEVTDGGTVVTTGVYSQQSGSLRVTIHPEGEVDEARWRVGTGTWQVSGATIDVGIGWKTVYYNDVGGWETPESNSVWIESGLTTEVSGTYEELPGSLEVFISPQGAIDAGAKWNVDGGAWRNSGDEVELPADSYTVWFKDVNDWTTPDPEIVEIERGEPFTTIGVYKLPGGYLSVTLLPSEVRLAGARWRVEDGDWLESGETVSGLSAGSHTVDYLEVPGWADPNSEQVQIVEGELTAFERTYGRTTGSLQVTIGPGPVQADARWRVDEGQWHESGDTESDLSTGAHIVDFNDVDDWVRPTIRGVLVNQGETTAITGTYSQPLIISELMADNESTYEDPCAPGQYPDWIEIYNPTQMSIDLDGWYLTDNDSNLAKWQFPAGVSVDPGGFFVLFASGDDLRDPNNSLHTNFNLGKNPGDYLALVGPDGMSVVHEYSPRYPDQLEDISYGLRQDASKLVSADSGIRYRVPTVGDAGANWTAIGYGDSGWPGGKASIGFDGMRVSRGVYYEYYEIEAGSWLPDFDLLTPAGQGTVSDFDISNRSQNDYFGFRFTAYIELPTSGNYTFYTTSDDGSELFIDDGLVVDNDGLHGMVEASGALYLDAGLHRIVVTMFENEGDEGLLVHYSSGDAGITKQEIPGDVLWAGPTTDVEDQMRTNNASLWVRATFYLEAGQIATFDTLALRIKYEDGYAAYLNGEKVAWNNAPASPAWNSTALAGRPVEDSMTFETVNLMPYMYLLETGKNVLAIQGLNDDKDDDEFLILCELIAAKNPEVPQYFTTPTPGTFNLPGEMGSVGELWFSHERGFYETDTLGEGFDLIISAETADADILWTDDGTVPSPLSPTTHLYTGPIDIDETTTIRAVAVKAGYLDSGVETQTYIFVEDVVGQSGTPAGWPSGSVNGQVLDYGMDPAITGHPTWGPQMEASLRAVPAISLVTNLDNLFDSVIGIYVNPGGDGYDWERPTSVELINPDGSDGFQIDAGLRIRGAFSRTTGNPKHSLRLFFRNEYGAGKLRYPLFGSEGVDEFDKVDLRTSQNYSWAFQGSSQNTLIRDVFSRDVQHEMGQPYTRSRYYHLYINGIYWGLYQTQERADADFAESYLGGDKEEYDVIKNDSSGSRALHATDGTMDAYRRLYDAAVAGFTSSTAYLAVQGLRPDGTADPGGEKLLDPENLMDYMICTYYTGDPDAPVSCWAHFSNNVFAIYNRVWPQGFTWYRHDAEHSLGANGGINEGRLLTDPTDRSIGQNWDHFNPAWLHLRLTANPDYLLQFADRVNKCFWNDGMLTAAPNIQRWMTRADQIDLAIIAESARWGSATLNKDDWEGQNNYMVNTFFPGRTQIVIDQMRSVNMFPYLDAPTLSHYGGVVAEGYDLTMTASGPIYYTLDGSDPRVPVAQSGGGGGVILVSETAAKKVRVPTGPLSGTGSIKYEAWFNIGGGQAVSELTSNPRYPGDPDETSYKTLFEAPVDYAENFGARMSGYVHPPVSGNYTFWISSDDNSELWLSTDENPANVSLIASVPGWTPSRDWTRYGEQQSSPRWLEAGQKYYIEALMKEGQIGDNLAVTWDSSGFGEYPAPISGAYLSPPGNAWATLNYNDSGWLSRSAPVLGVGYERSPGDPTNYVGLFDIDVEGDMYGNNETCYVRIPFTVASLDITQMTLKIRYDDAFVAFINGAEVARSINFAGTPEWNSGADSGRPGGDDAAVNFENFPISGHIDKLQLGSNILAIQGLNSGTTSSDFLISVQLEASQAGQGDISPSAFAYSGPIDLDRSRTVKARVLDGAWSPLVEATYAVGPVVDDLRITEIMYHPEETGDPEDPNKEYIELQNIGDDPINLNLVKFTEGIHYTFSDRPLGPGDYVLVVRKQSAFEAKYPGLSSLVDGTYTGKLDNAGERIRLEDAVGQTILDFEYKDGWRSITDGGGYSLTIIDPSGGSDALAEGLVGHWKFDDGAGCTATDSAGSNNGTLAGMPGDDCPEYGPTWTSGQIGGALSFDGSDRVSLAHSIAPLADPCMTVEAWVRPTSLAGDWSPVVTQNSTRSVGYYFYIQDGQPTIAVVSGGGSAVAKSPEAIGLNEWRHLAGTNDGANLKIYVDSHIKDSVSSAGLAGGPFPASFGYEAVTSGSFNGLIDDVRVYDRALSAEELLAATGPSELWGQKDAWRASAYVGGSPGDHDEGVIPDPGTVVISEELAHSHGVAADWIELYNTSGDEVDISGWYLSDSAANLRKYRFKDGAAIDPYGYLVLYEDVNFGEASTDPGKLVAFALSEDGEAVYLSSFEDAYGDLTGYRTVEDFGASETGVPFGRYYKRSTDNYNFVAMSVGTPGLPNAYPEIGKIVISEIMYNPASGNQRQEYIELYNRGPGEETLYDAIEGAPWKFTDGIDYTFIGPPGITLQEGDYLLIVKDISAFVTEYGAPPAGVVMFTYDGKLSNAGETLEISKPGDIDELGRRHYIRVDRVVYSDSRHPEDCPGGVDQWPPEADGGGQSLTRIDVDAYGNDPNNWVANGPTPGEDPPPWE